MVLLRQFDTTAYENDIFDDRQISLFVERQLLQRLSASCDLFFGRGEYMVNHVVDRTRGFSAGLGYQVWPSTQARLGYKITNLDSNIFLREYTKNTVSLGLTMQW